jgi:EpsD family peptidyl-prolyl cis-trans isomerase
MSRHRRANSSGTLARILLWPALSAAALALSSCGKADVNTTQVAAKINGEEISVHRVNNVIARGNDMPPEEARQTAAQALERIIDEELLVQRALKARLDRDPQIMQAIEGTKRQILAQAYIERLAGPGSTGGREEIGKFYRENPALFERRRIYRVRELVVQAPRGKLDALKAAASGADSIDGMAQWLRSSKLPFEVEVSSRSAEHIPLDMLPQLSSMREGQISVFPTPRGASVMQLVQSTDASLSEQQAAPVIERYLLSRRRLEATRAELGKLREQAKIEYVGEFAAAARPAAAVQPASLNADQRSDVGAGAHIEKGLAGLR